MVAINPEMLRELLDEFTEKEEVTREEMNAINQQIAELEKRIESSKVKLAGLNKDREKIDLMRERYLSGNWKLQLSNMAESDNGASASAAAPVKAVAAAPVVEPASAPAPVSHAEGRAARRAAREAAQPAKAAEPAATPTPTPAPVAAAPAPVVSAPEPVQVAPEPVVEAVIEPAAEPVIEPVAEPVIEVAPEPIPEPTATAEPEVIPEPQATAPDAPTFSSVAQFEAAQAESAIEHAPEDDPIMSSFSSISSNAPDVNSALAYGSQNQEVPVAEPENSGFSWSSTAITAVPGAEAQDNSAPSISAPEPAGMPNPWGSGTPVPAAQPELEQRQSAADIWGHPAAAAQQQSAPAAPAAQPAEGAWGDFGEDWQMKEAEAQRNAAANAPAPAPSEGGWGQAGGGSPWGNPASTPQPQPPVNTPPAGGGWGQPTASRQGMPAMQAPTSFPLAAPPAAPPAAADSSNSSNPSNPGDAWGRSGQASAGWATQGSPWGDPAGQPQAAPATAAPNPFSQPTTQPAQLPGTPVQPEASDEARSSLARAADGALISPVKGRRRGAGTPAAFDWGSPDGSSGNAGDPNQAGGSDDSGDNKKIDDVLKGLFK